MKLNNIIIRERNLHTSQSKSKRVGWFALMPSLVLMATSALTWLFHSISSSHSSAFDYVIMLHVSVHYLGVRSTLSSTSTSISVPFIHTQSSNAPPQPLPCFRSDRYSGFPTVRWNRTAGKPPFLKYALNANFFQYPMKRW